MAVLLRRGVRLVVLLLESGELGNGRAMDHGAIYREDEAGFQSERQHVTKRAG
jgi:hypothetical protein